MNISNLTKAASALFLVVVLSIVGYYGYHYRRENQAKEAWHTLEKSLDHNAAAVDIKIDQYKKFIKTWDGTRSSSTACYLVGKLDMERDEKEYENAIKYLKMANFTKGSILDTERHICLAQCYEHTNKPKKTLAMYDHVIKHAPSYALKIKALWATAKIYENGPLQNKKEQKKILQQIAKIPLDGIKGDAISLEIIDTAESMLKEMSLIK